MKQDVAGFTDIAGLRKAIFEAKEKNRRDASRAPILVKLRILEEMRDFTSSLRSVREAHKAAVKSAWLEK